MRISYLYIISLLFFLIGCAGLGTDIKVKRKWRNNNVLENDSGFIYTSVTIRSQKRETLSRYNLKTCKWDTLGSWFPDIDANRWDVNNSFFAGFTDSKSDKRKICVANLHKKVIINKYLAKNSDIVRISPDNIKIALFELVGWNLHFHTYYDSTSYYPFGSLYKIVVLGLFTGEKLFESQAIVLGKGMSWTSDSKNLIIVSTDSIQSLKPIKIDANVKLSFLKQQKLKKLPPYKLCLLNIITGERKILTEGTYPELVQNTGEITFCKEDTLHTISLRDFKIRNSLLKITPYWYDISPSGNTVISAVEHFLFYDVNSYLVAIDINNTSNRFIIRENIYHRFAWRLKQSDLYKINILNNKPI